MYFLDLGDQKDRAEKQKELYNFYLNSDLVNYKNDLLSLLEEDQEIIDIMINIWQIWKLNIRKYDWEYSCSILWILDLRWWPMDIIQPIWHWKTISESIKAFHNIIQKWWDFVVQEEWWYRNISFDQAKWLFYRKNKTFYNDYKKEQINWDIDILLKSKVVSDHLLNWNWLTFWQEKNGELYISCSMLYEDMKHKTLLKISWNNFDSIWQVLVKKIKSQNWIYYKNFKLEVFLKRNEEKQFFEEKYINNL